MSRQELRAPDAFQRAGLEVRAWISARKGLVIGLAVVLALAWFGTAVWRMVSEKREAKAREVMGSAMGVVIRPLAADVPLGMPMDPPPFKTEQERDQAARAALEGVRSSYPGTRPRSATTRSTSARRPRESCSA